MIWTMLVYFFAVIGVVAIVHYLIGLMFEEGAAKNEHLALRKQGGPHGYKGLYQKEGKLTHFTGKVKIRTGDYAHDFEEQMKEHREGHKR